MLCIASTLNMAARHLSSLTCSELPMMLGTAGSIATLILICGVTPAPGAIDAAQKSRLYGEAVDAWSRAREADARVSFTIRRSMWMMKDGVKRETVPPTRFEIRRDGDLASVLKTQKEGGFDDVSVSGPSYGFRLSHATSSDPYSMRALIFDDPKASMKRIGIDHLLAALASSHACWSVPLEDLISDPAFSLEGIRLVDNDRIVEVRFHCDYKKKAIHFKDGILLLEPARNWALIESQFSVMDGRRTTVTNQFDPKKGRTLKANLVKHRSEQLNNEEHYDCEFEDVRFGPVAESSFTLSAYGLPEPNRLVPTNDRSTIHFWFIGAAVVLLAAASAIRWRSRRLS